jgi:hypothetical protein
MSSVQVDVDVQALARILDDERDFALQFVREDLSTGLRNPKVGLKYPLVRLRGLGQITDEDEQQLGQVIDAVDAGKDVSELAAAILDREDASPLAVLLASLAATRRDFGPGLEGRVGRMQILTSAIMGAYLGQVVHLPGGGGRDLASILAAAGAAIVPSALATVRMLQASNTPRP